MSSGSRRIMGNSSPWQWIDWGTPLIPTTPAAAGNLSNRYSKSADEQLIASAYVEILYFHVQYSSISIKLYIAWEAKMKGLVLDFIWDLCSWSVLSKECEIYYTIFPLFQLHSSLQSRAQKRSSLILKMDKISPKLQSLKSTVIAMPGLGMSGKVKLLDGTVNILNNGQVHVPVYWERCCIVM